MSRLLRVLRHPCSKAPKQMWPIKITSAAITFGWPFYGKFRAQPGVKQSLCLHRQSGTFTLAGRAGSEAFVEPDFSPFPALN